MGLSRPVTGLLYLTFTLCSFSLLSFRALHKLLAKVITLIVGRNTVSSVPHTVSSVLHTVSSVLHTVSSDLHTVSSVLHTVSSDPHTVSSVLHTVSSVLHTVSSDLHTVSSDLHTHICIGFAIVGLNVKHVAEVFLKDESLKFLEIT